MEVQKNEAGEATALVISNHLDRANSIGIKSQLRNIPTFLDNPLLATRRNAWMSLRDRFYALRLTHVLSGGVVALLMVAVIFGLVAYLAISSARNRVQGMAQHDQVMLIAALKMELSIREMALTTLEFLGSPKPEMRDRILRHSADFKQHITQYRAAAQGDSTKTNYTENGAVQFKKYEAATLAMVDQRIEMEKILAGIQRDFAGLDQLIRLDLMGDITSRNPVRYDKLQLATQLERDAEQIISNLTEFLRTQSPRVRESIYREIVLFNANLAALEKLHVAPDPRGMIKEIRLRFGAVVSDLQRLLERNTAMNMQRAEGTEARKALDSLIEDSVQILSVRTVEVAKEGILHALNHVLWFAVVFTLMLLTIVGVLVLYAKRSVMRPVSKLHAALVEVNKTGNLDMQVELLGAPEVRAISGLVNQMFQQLSVTTVSKRRLETSQKQLEAEISERRTAQDALNDSNLRLRSLAVHDDLTGLPNRRGLLEDIAQTAARARRTRSRFAVLIVDLDHFKEVNDTKGHDVGDVLLQELAKRLRQCVREEDIVARMGGDEFVVLMPEIYVREDAAILAQKILNETKIPVMANEFELFWQASIGISTFPDDGHDAIALLKAADSALYRAKEVGRNCFHYYSEDLTINAVRRVEVADELRRALDSNSLFLHYQPQRSIADGTLAGVEALLRWKHPKWGMVSPDEFIPIAETTGLIVPIGEWVLREACTQARAWAQAGKPLRMAVNLSVRELSSATIVETVRTNLTGLDPGLLEIEITESMIMKNLDASVLVLRQLQALGVAISIDDFGTGYSSLSRINQLPLTRLKIDKSFVHAIGDGDDGEELVRAVIALGHALRLEVIAEGVETSQQLEFLRAERCGESQGYLGGRPMPPEEIMHLVSGGTLALVAG